MSSIKPDDSSSEIDGTQKVSASLIVACGNGSILLEFGKEVLNQVARFVQYLVILTQVFTIRAWWNDDGLALRLQRLKHSLIGIIALIPQYRISHDGGQQLVSAIQVTGLSGCEVKAERIAQCIDDGMNFGAQSTFAATNRFGLCLPPFAPALCWWARTMVESIMAYSLSASSAKC